MKCGDCSCNGSCSQPGATERQPDDGPRVVYYDLPMPEAKPELGAQRHAIGDRVTCTTTGEAGQVVRLTRSLVWVRLEDGSVVGWPERYLVGAEPCGS